MHFGMLSAALAYVLWGLFPLYFRELAQVPAFEILLHRIVWSLVFVGLLLAVRRQWSWMASALRDRKVLGAFTISALLLGANWLTYIWSVTHGHVVDSSLGYFITPLVNVLLGRTVLHERLRPMQWAAVALAAAGVLWLAWQGGHMPWIALLLAATFGGYGLLRKIAPLGALEGLALETIVLAPIAVLALGAGMLVEGRPLFPSDDTATRLLLIGTGPITAVPLLLFAAGARRIRMSTLGLLQYLGPSIQLALGLWLFREPFDAVRLAGFALTWIALALYSLDGWRATRIAAPR